MEEHRAIRALCDTITRCGNSLAQFMSPKSRWHWDTTEIQHLQQLYADEFWQHSMLNELLEPIQTMADRSCLSPEISAPIGRYHAKNYWREGHCIPTVGSHLTWHLSLKVRRQDSSFVLGVLSGRYTSPVRYVTSWHERVQTSVMMESERKIDGVWFALILKCE